MEQLYTHNHYQNVTEHKASGHSIWNRIYRYAQLQHREWVRLATPACMLYPVCCMHMGLAHHVLCRMCLHRGGTLADMWPLERLVHVAS